MTSVMATSAASVDLELDLQNDFIEWVVRVTPDPDLVAAGNGTMAVELSFEYTPEIDYGSFVVNPDFMQPVDTTLIPNPGQNPYTGTTTSGLQFHDEVNGIFGNGPLDAFFVSLGSVNFDTSDPKELLRFTASACFGGMLVYQGVVAQAGGSPQAVNNGQSIIIDFFGDADNERGITGGDLLAVTNNFGNTGLADGLLLGDADDDGAVSGSDLLAVINNFGADGPHCTMVPALNVAAIPEPASIVLLVGGLLLAISRHGLRNRVKLGVGFG